MPFAEVEPVHQVAFEIVALAAAQSPRREPLEIVRYATSLAVLNSLMLSNIDDYHPGDSFNTLAATAKLIDAAQKQHHLLSNCVVATVPTDMTDPIIAQVLRASSDIGMHWGHVSGETDDDDRANDWHTLEIIVDNPTEYLEFDGLKTSFNHAGRTLLVKNRPEASGCPMLGRLTDLGGRKTNLYGVFWQGFTEQYIIDKTALSSGLRAVN